MSIAALLAHGGAAGAAFEISFILVPVIIFAVLARWSKRKMDREAAEEAGEVEEGEEAEGAVADDDSRD
ncbi:MAG: hypothetical protein ABR540_11915 [Acidimicrobiales bacterium]